MIYAESILPTDLAQQCKFFYDEARYKEALNPCTKTAKEHNLSSQTILGELLDNGSAGVLDRQQALIWWEKAADKNYIEAENFLAMKYYYGGTIFEKQKFWQQDYKKAFAIWFKGAKRGVASSQFMVADMYRLGQGRSINLVEALAWYQVAQDGKYKLAADYIYQTLKEMTANEKILAEKQYHSYLKKYSANR